MELPCSLSFTARTLFTSLKKHTFKEITDVLLGMDNRVHQSVQTLTVIHECSLHEFLTH